MIDLGDRATVKFLDSGCALLVCTVSADGQPHAGRAWGLSVVDVDAHLLRLLVEADDAVTVANVRAGRAIAVTATSVRTFHSLQLKGRALSLEELTPADEAKQAQYTSDFLKDILDTSKYAPDVMCRWAERPVTPCFVTVDVSFDQTPGPSAGATIDRGDP